MHCRSPLEGDRGYGKPPRYWEASSVGQVYTLLELEPTQARFIAAGDTAYMQRTIACVQESISVDHRMAFFQRNKTEDQFNKKKGAGSAAKAAKKINLGKLQVVDMTSRDSWWVAIGCFLYAKHEIHHHQASQGQRLGEILRR